jgi:hypothetical protein
LKKGNKKLLVLRAVAMRLPHPAGPKVFLLLFLQKKKFLLALPCLAWLSHGDNPYSLKSIMIIFNSRIGAPANGARSHRNS